MLSSFVDLAARDIEARAGAGDFTSANDFIHRVLDYDNSAETRASLHKHLERSGHPELLAP